MNLLGCYEPAAGVYGRGGPMNHFYVGSEITAWLHLRFLMYWFCEQSRVRGRPARGCVINSSPVKSTEMNFHHHFIVARAPGCRSMGLGR